MNQRISRRSALAQMGGLLMAATLPRGWRWPVSSDPFKHPEPRPGITGENVLPVEKLPKRKSVREAFDAARTYPEIFDGVACACDCLDSMKHRSLLSCFESDQPFGCHACREEAELIVRFAKQGKSLAEIRHAIDKKWG